MSAPIIPLETRLMAKVVTDPATGCHRWTGGQDGKGNGKIRVGAQQERVHRVAYRLFVGPVPDGKYVRHTCTTSTCVNPQHLQLIVRKPPPPTHCPEGHPYPPESRLRRCNACRRAQERTAKTRPYHIPDRTKVVAPPRPDRLPGNAATPPFLNGTRRPCMWPSTRDLFVVFNDRGERQEKRIEAAKAVCADCPVRRECAQFALDVPQRGIWGGTTEDERHVWRKRGALPRVF